MRELLRSCRESVNTPVFFCHHSETIDSTAAIFPQGRDLAFFYRDPIERFVSAFASRCRMGRPIYHSMWSEAEAVTFSEFATPSELAEALDDIDERRRSFATFGFRAISHLRRGLQYHLHSVERLREERDRVRLCIKTENIDERLLPDLDAIGISISRDVQTGERNRNPGQSLALSARARRNLRSHFSIEYKIFRYLERNFGR